MPITLKPINSQSDWQSAEARFKPRTFLQSWEWGMALEAQGYKIFRLSMFNGDYLVGIAFVYLIKAKRGSFLFCPHGPVIDWDKAGEFMPEFLKYLKELGSSEKADFIRISPLAPDTAEMAKIFKNLSFKPAPVHMMHPELAWILNIAPDEDELLKQMEKRTRYSIRKAQKDGVKITSSASQSDLNKFLDLYSQTAARQGFVPFSKNYLTEELRAFAPSGKIKIYLAFYNDELIAGAIIVYSCDSAFYHHGASNRKFSNINETELIQWQAILDAKNRGLKFYNFWGIAPDNEPKHPWAGLSKFKKGFGGVAEKYLHAQDYALTSKYWLNYLIEKLRKIKRGY